MQNALKKAGALTLGVSALGFLMAHAALTYGCRRVDNAQAQAPASPGAAAPETSPNAAYPPSYMGATKAPPMPLFQPTAAPQRAAPPQAAPPARSNAQAH